MWLRHWQLAADPFSQAESRYVPTPTHEAILAQLASEVERGASLLGLTGMANVGKSVVACELARRLRTPRRRVLIVHDQVQLANSLTRITGGSRSGRGMDLTDVFRVLRLEGLSLLLIVDGIPACPMLDRLAGMARTYSTNLCLMLVNPAPLPLDLRPLHLQPLTRSEAANYLQARLCVAARDAATFSPPALARLHAESGGCPGKLDSLAREALIRSAVRGESLVSSAVVREVARQTGPAGWYERLRVG